MEVGAVPYGPRTLKGAAAKVNDVIAILSSELATRGLSPKHKMDEAGNYYSLGVGFAVEGKIYYRAVGNDVILTPEVHGKSWIWLLCCLGLCPAVIAAVIRSNRQKKAYMKLAMVLEAVDAVYRSQHGPEAGREPGLF